MAKRLPLIKYWPAVLFAISNIAAVALVLKANRSYEPATTSPTLRPNAKLEAKAADPKGFEPLDSVAPGQGGNGYSPLLFDWGNEFDVDKNGRRPTDGLGLFAGLANKLDELRRPTLLTLADGRPAPLSDADLLARSSLYRPTGLLGLRSPLPPPFGGSVPPLSLTTPLAARPLGGDPLTPPGPRVMDITVDPELFKDPAAMAAFIADLTQSMIRAGVTPRVQIGRPGTGIRANGKPLAPPAGVTVPPPARQVHVAPSATTPLPKPPADVARPDNGPVFHRELPAVADGRRTIGEPPAPAERAASGPARRPTALGPVAPERGPEAVARHSEGPRAIELSGSSTADTSGGKPAAKPASKPEPVVSIRIQLARFADKAAAERALGRLKSAGFGGVLTRDTSAGIEYWVVHSKTFTKRSEANAALTKVRHMGYEAWQS